MQQHGFLKSPVRASVTPPVATNLIKALSVVFTVLAGLALVAAYAGVAELRHMSGAGSLAFLVLASSVSLMWIIYSRVIVDCLNALFHFAGLHPDIDEDSGARLAAARHEELERARQMFGRR